MSVLFLFVDGFGIGADDPAVNPVAGLDLPGFRMLLAGGRPVVGGLPEARNGVVGRGIDACLGVPGKPRSGSGHVALLAGVNAPALIGRHEGPYPGTELRAVLRSGRTLPSLARQAGRRVIFANAFSPTFHERLARAKARWSGFGLACELAGLRIRGQADLLAGEAISAWPTNRVWIENGFPAPPLAAVEAGRILGRLAADHDLTLFEYFATDFSGHRGDRPGIIQAIRELDELLIGALEILRPAGGSIVVASDHGNVEDWTAPGHTLAPALFAAAGPIAPHCAGVWALPDVMPAVLAGLGIVH